MRKVVDSNYLRTAELHHYLSASRTNIAVITDYAELEMVKANTLEAFLKSTEVLARYPRQVVLAKSIDEASSLRGNRKGLKKRLTDGKRTREFRKWCGNREQIKRGERLFKHDKAREGAFAHLDEIQERS
jgi:hypothetical protein